MKKKEKSYTFLLASIAFLLLIIIFSSTESIAARNTSPEATYAYITNGGSGTVSVIDTATNTVIATVDVGSRPEGIAILPDGTEVYVANLGSSTVSIIDTETGTVTATVNVGNNPHGVAVNPPGTKIYVTNYGSNTVSVIDTATGTVTATVTVGNHPFGVAVAGTKVYVTNDNDRTVSVIDTVTDTVIATLSLENQYPGGVAATGTKVYVTSGSTNTVSVVDTSTSTVTATIPVGERPTGIAVAGTELYVANFGSSTVSVIDTATNSVTTTVNVGNNPYGVAVTPDGTEVYVTNDHDNTVSVIDTATDTVTATVSVGNLPKAFGQFIGYVPVSEVETTTTEQQGYESAESYENTPPEQTANTQTTAVNNYNDNDYTETNTVNNYYNNDYIETNTVNNYYDGPAENPEKSEDSENKETYQPESIPAEKPEVSSASVSLHGEKTEVIMGEDILLRLSAVNLITKPTLHVQVIIIPPSGMSVSSSEFVQSGAGQYTTTYDLEPGKGRDIEVRIESNQEGNFNVKGRVIYYFGDDIENAEDHALDLPIRVKGSDFQPATEDKSITIPDVSGPGVPCLVLMLIIVFILRRD